MSLPGGSSTDDEVKASEWAGGGIGCAFGLVATILLGVALAFWSEAELEAIHQFGLIGIHAEPSYGMAVGAGLCFGISALITLGGLGLLYRKPHGALAVLAVVGITMCLCLAVVTFDALDHYDVYSEVHAWDAPTDALRADFYSQLSGISGALLSACCCLGVLPSMLGAGILFQRRRVAS